jgi:hypothetical protein
LRFLGTTLWSNFRLYGTPSLYIAAMREAQQVMNDFRRIRVSAASERVFSPADAGGLFRRESAWLAQMISRPFDGPTVVVTHHAPSRSSIHPRFDGALLNASYVSDAQYLLDAGRVDLWIHGHTHDSFDYQLGDTRVVCNPRGYVRGGVAENPHFDVDFTVDIGTQVLNHGREAAVFEKE